MDHVIVNGRIALREGKLTGVTLWGLDGARARAAALAAEAKAALEPFGERAAFFADLLRDTVTRDR